MLQGARIPAQPAERAAAAYAADTRIRVRADSRLWLEGSSNVRDWTCKATTMEATIDLEDAKAGAVSRSVRGVSVQVPVRSLKCGDRHMEKELYTALKAPKGAEQTFITARFDRIPNAATSGESTVTEGQLTVAGAERTVQMTVRSDRLPDGSYKARGTVPIRMTDFGIKPPRPWGGILRTADKVLIQFEIFVAPVAPVAPVT